MSESSAFDGKVVIVTGAAGGLGRAFAQGFGSAGASVVVADIDAMGVNETAAMLTAAGTKAIAVTVDVTNRQSTDELAQAALTAFGRIDVMINNAGLMPHSPLARLKIDDWEQMIDVNLKGVLYGIAAALPHMISQKSGHIIMVSSVAGHKVRPGSAVYAATKTGVRVIAEGLRQEVKPHNIRTTVISPGAVATNLADSITEPDIAKAVRDFTAEYAVPADSFARMVAFAMSQPDDVDVNEILYRPTRQEL